MGVGAYGELTKPSGRSDIGTRLYILVSLVRKEWVFRWGALTPSGLLKVRCIANLFSWSNLLPVVNAAHLLDFISQELVLTHFLLHGETVIFCKFKCHIL